MSEPKVLENGNNEYQIKHICSKRSRSRIQILDR